MARNNIDIQPILLSAEQRLAELLIDSYAGAADRNIADLVATRIETDGSSVRVRIFEPTVTFKTSLREDDVEFTDMDPTRIIDVAPTFKHAGIRVGASQLADSGGEAAAKLAAWGEAAGSSAGLHTGNRAISILKANPTCVWDNLALFANNHPTGFGSKTFANTFTADISSGVSLDQANINLANVLAKINSIPNKAGYAIRFKRLWMLVPSALLLRARQLTTAAFLPSGNGTVDQTVSTGFGLQVVEVPEIGYPFTGVSTDDTTYYIVAEPLSGYGGLILVDRAGLTVQMHGPATSAENNRRNNFEYVARFRNEVLPGRPSHIHRCTA